MAIFPETQRAFERLPANNLLWQGEHTHSKIRPTSQGIYIGSAPFNPEIHELHDIDHLSPIGLALGEDHVYQTLPGRGLVTNLVVDSTRRADIYPIADGKRRLTTELSDTLYDVKEATDRILTYALVDPGEQAEDRSSDAIEVCSSAEATSTIAELAARSLTFVISDFQRLRLEPGLSLENVIAIKVNHTYERRLTAGLGVLPLGGFNSVNTGRKRELAKANEKLEQEHMAIVEKLCKVGAAVASVVIDPRLARGFDVDAADKAIASAIKSKH